MKLFYSPTSPYVRKVTVTAEVTGHSAMIERVAAQPHPIKRDHAIIAANPLGKAPTLVTDEGMVLFDSRVIVEYLDAHSRAGRVMPDSGAERWRLLTRQALGDGILDAALLLRYEGSIREDAQRSAEWIAGQTAKITDGLNLAEQQVVADDLALNIGNITIGAALSFLDLRLPHLGWRDGRDALARWHEAFDALPEMAASRPVG